MFRNRGACAQRGEAAPVLRRGGSRSAMCSPVAAEGSPGTPFGASAANPQRPQTEMRHRGNHPFFSTQQEGLGLHNLPNAPRAAAASPAAREPALPIRRPLRFGLRIRAPGSTTQAGGPGGEGGAGGRDQNKGEGRGPGRSESESRGEGCGGADVTRMEGEGRARSMNGGRGRHEGRQGRGKSTRS